MNIKLLSREWHHWLNMNMSRFQIDLTPAAALAVYAFVFVAVFAWAHQDTAISGVVDGGWLWRLWHIGTLIIAIIGVSAAWLMTKSCPWVRGLGLCVFTVVVFINSYNHELFGIYSGTVWHTANSLFIGFTNLAAVVLLRRRAYLLAIVVVVIGYGIRINGLLFDVRVIWDIMNPLIMLTALACAVDAFQTKTAPEELVS